MAVTISHMNDEAIPYEQLHTVPCAAPLRPGRYNTDYVSKLLMRFLVSKANTWNFKLTK